MSDGLFAAIFIVPIMALATIAELGAGMASKRMRRRAGGAKARVLKLPGQRRTETVNGMVAKQSPVPAYAMRLRAAITVRSPPRRSPRLRLQILRRGHLA